MLSEHRCLCDPVASEPCQEPRAMCAARCARPALLGDGEKRGWGAGGQGNTEKKK